MPPKTPADKKRKLDALKSKIVSTVAEANRIVVNKASLYVKDDDDTDDVNDMISVGIGVSLFTEQRTGLPSLPVPTKLGMVGEAGSDGSLRTRIVRTSVETKQSPRINSSHFGRN